MTHMALLRIFLFLFNAFFFETYFFLMFCIGVNVLTPLKIIVSPFYFTTGHLSCNLPLVDIHFIYQ